VKTLGKLKHCKSIVKAEKKKTGSKKCEKIQKQCKRNKKKATI